ncbi:MAG: hypothetical protein IJN44_05085 [Clostridia bacterium]|nr:hypothetical protein [Clostridia bacterium]
MEGFKKFENFQVAAYVFAYYLNTAEEKDIQKGIDFYKKHIHLDKVYIENHRGKIDISQEKLRMAKAVFEKNGILVAGGITSTQFVNGIRKPSYYDTFCYTDPDHRAEYLRIVKELAEVFDEIILDDFFFTGCRCEMCIEQKGNRSWARYRLDMMEQFSHEIVDLAKSVNPKMNFIIKYPNWYESYQETGYNPGKQKDIFDMIYTGTETRDPVYSAQHLQRYESYSIIRLMENTAPGKNGGGWIDPFGASDNMNVFLEQAHLTLLAKAKELMLFNFSVLEDTPLLPALGHDLYRIDRLVGMSGKPVGVSVWEPFDGDGEDQLYNYLGMCGLNVEPTPYFNEDAPVVLFTQSTAHAPDAMEKLEKYVRSGGNAVVTAGFFHEMYHKGIKELTSVRLTHRHVLGNAYMINHANYTDVHYATAPEKVLFEVLDYKTNASVSDITLIAGEDNFPIMTEDNYGKGRFFILNVPENFAELYKLPREVIQGINKHLSMGQRMYLGCTPKYNLFAYDNNVYGIRSYRPMADVCQVIVRGKCKGLRDLETGAVYDACLPLATPCPRGDATCVIDEPAEFAFPVKMAPGTMKFFEIID